MVKIEAGQIVNPDSFPPANELVCIQVLKVFDQVSLRDCVTRTVTLTPDPGTKCPVYAFEGADDFDIVEVKVISKTDSLTKPGFKKLKLFVRIRYTIHYSDGIKQLTTTDDAAFNLTINEIYCPSCTAQIGVIQYPSDTPGTIDADGLFIKIEALAESFNDVLNSGTGVLMLDIGVFFIVKCECVVQLLIPAYGYCPVPPEQQNPAVISCKTFLDRTKIPFPTQFFPDQKVNPLDKKGHDCHDGEWDS